jgi:hypothetical protein
MKEQTTLYARKIMHLKEINKGGYFKGEFNFGETSLKSFTPLQQKVLNNCLSIS